MRILENTEIAAISGSSVEEVKFVMQSILVAAALVFWGANIILSLKNKI